MRILLLGGTRFAGRRLAERLVAAGDQVAILHRGVTEGSIAGASTLHGDRSRPDGLDALHGQRFDAAVDFSGYDASWVAAAADRLAGQVDHYVFISSATTYAETERFPLRESDPADGNAAWGDYAQQKVRAERCLRAAHDEGRFAATIVRLHFVMGPASYADRERFILNRLAAGRPILLPGGGMALNSYVHVDDVVDGLRAVLGSPDLSGGRTFNLTHARAFTSRGLVDLLARAAGLEPHVVSVPAQVGTAGYTVDLSDVIFPVPDQHLMTDVTLARDVLGFAARRPLQVIARDVVEWWRAFPDHSIREYPAEQRALAEAGLSVR